MDMSTPVIQYRHTLAHRVFSFIPVSNEAWLSMYSGAENTPCLFIVNCEIGSEERFWWIALQAITARVLSEGVCVCVCVYMAQAYEKAGSCGTVLFSISMPVWKSCSGGRTLQAAGRQTEWERREREGEKHTLPPCGREGDHLNACRHNSLLPCNVL